MQCFAEVGIQNASEDLYRAERRVWRLTRGLFRYKESIMSKNRTDPISSWFHVAEQLGEYIGIRFGRVPAGAVEPEWMFVRHSDFDGIGGFAELLRRRGADLPRLAQLRHPAKASRLRLLRALAKYLKPRQKLRWGDIERGPAMSSSPSQPPRAVAFHLFDDASTTQIRRVCRKNAVSVNSFLLKHLTKAVRPFLQDQAAVVPWMIPVNLRGKVTRERDTANFTSYVGVKVCSYESVNDIHLKIYAALGRGEHWANWYAYKLGGLLTTRMKRWLIVKELAMSQWNLGSFSNLGDWDPERTISQADCEGGWLFAPPVLRCQLLGAGCVTFQNRLSLTIQVHPDLTTSAAVPQAWIQAWVKEIEIDVASVTAEPLAGHWLTA
ncbi:hypothetical protein SBV1_1860006 [Verrucomicrobia bacterium]|nr:hypothetical protein SBV1_1860006 [Verrucomicrobiota bacterium]